MYWTVFLRNGNYAMLGLVFAHLCTLSMQQGDCDFETTLCGFQQDSTDDFDWTRQQGPTGTDDTGPSSDHTTGNGYYMYIETSSPQATGDVARLTSPSLSNDIKCLEFWYHMYGDSTEELNVYVRTTGSFQRPGILTWSKSGDKGDVWRRARVHLEQGSDFNVVFEGVRGTSYRGDIAIDDISFRTESCGGQCDFDNGLCGYQQDNTDDFEWKRQQGSTATSNTGPTSDHTTGIGSYMYIETSSPQAPGDIARLVSPVLSSDTRCLEFWYHMYGDGTGELRVYQTSTGSSQLGTPKWSLTGDQGNAWRNATVGLEAGSNYHIVFEGVRGSGIRGDIAIDDVTVRTTSCGGATVATTATAVTTAYPATAEADTTTTLQVTTPAPTTEPTTSEVATTPSATTTEAIPSEKDCNFDTDECGYQQDSTDDFDWTRKIGTTSSSNTGPSSDHTTGSGYYMYIETSSQATGNVARLITPSLPTNTKCLEFWYHMYGSDTEELRVYQRPTGTTQLETPIWSLSGEQGDVWDQAMVEIVPVNNFEIVFEGVRGSGFKGDIAIDDVRFRATSCPDGNCNFDSTLCGYHQDNTDDFDWTLQQDETGTDDTGPSSDHTSGAGYYMYIETSSPRQAGDLARLVSPVLSGDTRCLEFWYNMYGDHTEELRVYLRSTGSAELGTLIWSQTGDQGDVWLQATVDLVATRNFYVVFEGVRGTSYRGDIAIDDISFRKTPCVVTTMATTTTTLATTTPSTTTDTVVTTNPMTTEATTTTPLQTTTYEPSTEGTTTSFEPLITYMTTTSSATTFPSATTDIVTTDIVTTTTPLKTTTYEPSTEGTTSTLQPSTTYMKTTTSITTHETTEEAAATTSEYATTMPTATTVTTDAITSSKQQAFTTTEPMSTPAVTLELTTESETTSVVPTTSTTTQQTSSPDLTTTLEETTEDLSTLSPTTVETTTTVTTDEDTTHVATTAPPIAISSVTTFSKSTVAKQTTTVSHAPSTASTDVDVPTAQPPDTTSLSTTKQPQIHTTKQSTTKPGASTATQPTAKPGPTKPSTGKPTTGKAPPCGKDCTTVPDYKVTGKSEAQGGLSIGIIVGAGAGGAVVVILVVVIIIVAVKCRRSDTNRRKNSDWEVANPMYDVAMGPTKHGNNNNKNGGKRDDDFYTFNMNTSNV